MYAQILKRQVLRLPVNESSSLVLQNKFSQEEQRTLVYNSSIA